jgi:hypothetical protein
LKDQSRVLVTRGTVDMPPSSGGTWLQKVLSLFQSSPIRPLRQWTRWLGRTWARLSYGRHIEPTWLELTSLEITLADLAPAFDGFRIVHLSDLHHGHGVPLEYLSQAVELANAQQPDLIAVTGDFIHKGFGHVEHAARVVGRLRAHHGVLAVLGNHDFSVRNALGWRRHRGLHSAIETALIDEGVQVLRNESIRLQRDAGHLHVLGVDDLWSGACDLDAAYTGVSGHEPCLLLAHNPRTVERLNGRRSDLVLSGHTHGGQVDWPGLGRLFLSKTNRRFAAGLYRHGETLLYVNRGVGFGFRFRFKVRPEVAVITLRSPAGRG